MNHQYVFEGLEVRIVQHEETVMFVASDVCRALGIVNSRSAVEALSEDEKGVGLTDTLGGEQEVLTVTEPGLYRLIFRSRKEAAERFRRWVFHEVLPELRATGAYRLKHKRTFRRQSVIGFLSERFPGVTLAPKALREFGAGVRKMAYAMGVPAVVLEDDHYGEALAFPVPFLESILNSVHGVKRLPTQSKESS